MDTVAFTDFYHITYKLITRHGTDVLDAPRFSALLIDYSQNRYPDESRLLLLALKAGIHQKIAASSGAEELCEKIADTFSENYFLEQDAAECIVRLLWSLIHKTPFSLPKLPVRSLTAKSAGIYTDWRKQKPPAIPAGKTARYTAGDFIHIAGVTFTYGSMEPYVTRNIRKVTLAPFSIMNRPISQLEYWELSGDSPSYQRGDCLPVDGVNRYQAVEFCNLKNTKEGLDNVYTVDKKKHDPNNTDPAFPTYTKADTDPLSPQIRHTPDKEPDSVYTPKHGLTPARQSMHAGTPILRI